MQLPVEYLLLRMGIAQQSLIAVRNEIMQVCVQMPVEGTNVVALEQILVMCETTLASLDRTYVRLTAWKQIYPNHAGTVTPGNLAFDDGDWMPINDDDVLNLNDDDVLNLNDDDVLNLNDDDSLDLDDDDDDDSLDLNDDDLYRDPEDKQREYTQDECDGYFLPLSFAQDNLPVTDNSLTNHEFALLFGLVQAPDAPDLSAMPSTSAVPVILDIFGDPITLPSNLIDIPTSNQDADPDYNVPGSL